MKDSYTSLTLKMFLLIAAFQFNFLIRAQESGNKDAFPVVLSEVDNLYKVSPDLYRSGQPSGLAVPELNDLGVKTILNLRNLSGNGRYKGTGVSEIVLKRKRINTWRIDREDLLEAFRIFEKSPKPVLVHCKHGADRTGAFVAAYRIMYQSWSVEDAIDELRNGGYGFHAKYFENIPELLRSVNFDLLRNEIKEQVKYD